MSEIFYKGLLKALNKVIDFLLSALAERKGRLSIGRLLLISVFILAMFKWSAGLDLPSTMTTVLLSLISYIMGTKIVTTLKSGETNSTNKGNEKEGSKKTPDIED